MTAPVQRAIAAGDLEVGFLESGDPSGPAVVLLHGFPYDVHAYDAVAAQLAGQGARVMRDFAEGSGIVKLDNGETWTARLAPEAASAALFDGDRATVTRIDGAIAYVVPFAATSEGSAPEEGTTDD